MTKKDTRLEVGEKVLDLLFASDLELKEILETLDLVSMSIELAVRDIVKGNTE